MVSIERISLILIAVALFAINTFSQSKKITENDLDSIVRSAISASSVLPRREKAVTEMFNYEGLPARIIFTKTFLPPDRSQTFYSDGDEYVTETIMIGPNFYIKRKDGTWKLETPEERASYPPPPKAIAIPTPADETVKVVLRTNVELDNHKTDFYEMKKTGTRVNRNGKYKSTEINRYWINKNGTLSKQETETTASNSKEIYRRTVTYEYDPKIKIEAPIK